MNKNIILLFSCILLIFYSTQGQKIEAHQKIHEKNIKIGKTLYQDADEEFKTLVNILVEDLNEKVQEDEFYKTRAFLNVLATKEPSSKYANLFSQYNVSYETYLQNLKKGFTENITQLSDEEEKVFQAFIVEAESFFEKEQKHKPIDSKHLKLDRDQYEILSLRSFYKLKAYTIVAAEYSWLDYAKEDLPYLKSDYDYYLDKMLTTSVLNSNSRTEKKLTKENYRFVKSPVFEGCDPNLANQELEDCTQAKIRAFFNANFDTKQAQEIMDKNNFMFFVHFDIDENGKINNIQAYTPNKKLDALAKETLAKLPTLKPAKSNGEAVAYNYVLPFAFGNKVNDILAMTNSKLSVPVYPGCYKKLNNDQLRNCMNEKVSAFLNESSLYNEASKVLGQGTYMAYVRTLVTKKGKVEIVKTVSNKPKLIPIVEEVIAGLPKMKPGLQNGKAVGVIYTIPINLKIEDTNSTTLQKAPIFPGCAMDLNNTELYDCMEKKIRNHFRQKMAKSELTDSLVPGNYSTQINFSISEKGKITASDSHGNDEEFNSIVEEVISGLPSIFPAKSINNKAIESQYCMTFSFQK